MYTLYYSPGSCSLVIHCLLEEMGLPFRLQRVNIEGDAAGRAEYRKLNPKGKVPALGTADGVLTEAVAIVEFLCDKHGKGALLAEPGSWERARTLERMATLATEVHPLMNRFFHDDDFSADPAVRAGVKARGVEKLLAYFRAEDAALGGREFWSGPKLTAADFYFMVVARWGRWLTPPANEMPGIRPFYERMVARPAVARAFAAEGIKAFGTT
jgi:glutathione S-transferase